MNRKIEVGCMVLVIGGVEAGRVGTVISFYREGEYFIGKYAQGVVACDTWLVNFGKDMEGLFIESYLMRIDGYEGTVMTVESEVEA